jgi:hypothetical protein
MKTVKSSATVYEAPQASLLLVRIEQNLLTSSETRTSTGENVTMLGEEDFDDFFN